MMDITQDLAIHKPAFKAYDDKWAPRLTLSQVRLHKSPVRQSYTSTRLIEKGMVPALDQSTIQAMSTIPNLASLEKGRYLLNELD
ncbi:hypothetical protein BGZ90_000304 [Linnemannia elongata]|nr:hypothetical protein BGZ90_000304 [Linnemannia elongata]